MNAIDTEHGRLNLLFSAMSTVENTHPSRSESVLVQNIMRLKDKADFQEVQNVSKDVVHICFSSFR